MNEELIRQFLEQVKKDKFNIKNNIRVTTDFLSDKPFLNDSVKNSSSDSDDKFLDAFENFAELVCPKVDAGELKCMHMMKPVKEKKSRDSYKEKLKYEKVKESIKPEYRYKPEIRQNYYETGISMAESLKTMRELRNREEELRREYKKF